MTYPEFEKLSSYDSNTPPSVASTSTEIMKCTCSDDQCQLGDHPSCKFRIEELEYESTDHNWDTALTNAIVECNGKIQPYSKILKYLSDNFKISLRK